MAETYTVNYNINVQSEKAQQALTAFQTATTRLTEAGNRLTAFQKKLDQTIAKFSQMSKRVPSLDVKVSAANRKLDTVIRKLERINALAKQNRTITITTGTRNKGVGGIGGGGSNMIVNNPSSRTPRTTRNNTGSRGRGSGVRRISGPKNLAYKVLGPTMIDSGGIGALDMLKGMGIAYGITGLGSMISNVIKDSAEYNNLIQSTRNILQTHDKKPNFNGRFAVMERIIRDVGVQTKFTAPEVADASKFLAMAGLDLDAISHAIRPIANLALIGDTDLATTADKVTNIMTAYNVNPERMSHVADILTMAMTSGNTDLMGLAEAYQYSAPLFSAAKVSMEESAAALSALGSAGIQTSQAGTTMRTIMMNLANPTKKMKAAWNEIGVTTTDEKGNLRDLIDIFKDLHEKGLSLGMAGRLFNRTATPGAVALAANVDVWEQIMEDNYRSHGLAERLANEKKNTIQGLWAQITSMFTEDGMQAFEKQQGEIRKFMLDLLSWLKTDDATKALESLGKAFLDILKLVKDFTMVLLDLWNRFNPLITLWLKTQMILSAVLIPLRIFRAMMNFSALVFSGAKSIGVLIAQFGRLFSTLNTGRSMQSQMGQMWGALLPRTADGKGIYSAVGKMHDKVDAPVLARYQRMYGKRAALTNFSNGIGGMIGASLGGYMGSQVGESGSTTNMVATVGGATVGGAALPSLLKHLPKLGALGTLAMSNPWTAGLTLAAAAVATLVTCLCKASEAIKEGHNAAQLWITDFQKLSIAGMDVTKQFGLIQAYQRIAASSLDAAEKEKLRRQAFNMYNASTKESTQLPDNSAVFATLDAGKGFNENLNWADKTWGKYAYFMPILQELGMRKVGHTVAGEDYNDWDIRNHRMFELTSKDWNSMNEQEAVRAALYIAGRDRNSPLMQKINDVAFQSIYSIGRSQDVYDTWNQIKNDYIPSGGIKYSWGVDDARKATYMDMMKNAYYVWGLQDQFSSIKAGYEDWERLIRVYDDTPENVTQDLIQKVLHTLLGSIMDPKYGVFGSDEWNKAIQDIVQNPQKYNYASQNDAITAIQKTFIDLCNFFNLLDNNYRPLFTQYLNRNIWENVLPDGKFNIAGGYHGGKNEGDTMTVDGVMYKWKQLGIPYAAGQYGWVDDKGNPFIPKDASQTQVSQIEGANDTNPTNANGTGGTGANASDYKNHYAKGNAAPKQVIVRIEKLMNVENVDLANPEKAAIINDLKSQLTQALVDVVHDFDETWNG